MASFKDLKNKLKRIEPEKKPEPKTIETQETSKFEYEEARYLLGLIAKSDFKGQDVQVVYNIVLKLQTLIKENLNTPDA